MGTQYLDAAGLRDGLIPSGTACPFSKDCSWKTDNCPTKTNLKSNDFSCAAARMHAMLTQTESPLMRSLVKKTRQP